MDFQFYQESIEGIELTVLQCKDGRRSSSISIAPEYGANLCRWMVDGHAVIDFDPVVLKARSYTGTPVLYPTPSCVRDGMFSYKGRLFRYDSASRPAYEHGLVHDQPWQFDTPRAVPHGISMKLWIDFAKDTPQYMAFPFLHTFYLEYMLGIDGVWAHWGIRNREATEIPFGFALHPYFTKLSGEENTYVSLPATLCMEASSDLLPTGRLINVTGQPYDLRHPRPLKVLDLDHVFTGLDPHASAVIEYKSLNMSIVLEAGESMTHIVFYSPKGERYFCIENQTCSTDAHNLYAKGFVAESGLKMVPALGTFEDFIHYIAVRG